jgi:tetratricopeptide (TPR) repeat protein
MRFRRKPVICLALALAAVVGCSRDPQVRKKHFLDQGVSYFEKGNCDAAVVEYENAIQIDSDYAAAHYELSRCLEKKGDWTHAFQELSRSVQLDPNNFKAQLDLADLYLAGRRFQDARDHAAIVLGKDPQNARAEVIASNADAALGDSKKGLSEAQQAVQMDPNRSLSYLNLAFMYERSSDIAAAEQNFLKARSLDPRSASVTIALGSFYQRQNRWGDAEKELNAAIAMEPQNPAPRVALANLYLSQGKRPKAEQIIQQAKTALKDSPAGYRLLGDFYLSQGELDKAADEFSVLYSQHPKDKAIAETYAQLLVQQNHLDQANKLNDANLRNFPSDPGAVILKGAILNRQQKQSDAVPVLEQAIKNAPDNAVGHFQLGLAYAGTKNLGQAEAQWREAVRLQPTMPDAHRALASLALQKHDAKLLAESGAALKSIAPGSADGYIYEAQSAFWQDDHAAAETDLKKAIEVAPQNPAGYIQMGDLRLGQKKTEEAEKYFAQALKLDPSSSDALVGLVNIAIERKDAAKALRLVQDQIALVPNSSNFYFLLGQIEIHAQDQPKADAAFRRAVDLDKNNVPAVLSLGGLQVTRGSVDQAIATYQQAIQQNSGDARLYAGLGGALEAHQDWQQAQEAYRKALEIQPDYALAANNLAYVMLEHGGDVNVAFSLAQAARKGLPHEAFSADTLGWAYYKQGIYNAAIGALQEAVKSSPENSTYHYHLGLAYQKSNNLPMAKKEFASALMLNPKPSQAEEIRKIVASLSPGK